MHLLRTGITSSRWWRTRPTDTRTFPGSGSGCSMFWERTHLTICMRISEKRRTGSSRDQRTWIPILSSGPASERTPWCLPQICKREIRVPVRQRHPSGTGGLGQWRQQPIHIQPLWFLQHSCAAVSGLPVRRMESLPDLWNHEWVETSGCLCSEPVWRTRSSQLGQWGWLAKAAVNEVLPICSWAAGRDYKIFNKQRKSLLSQRTDIIRRI